ncbi:MAG: 30S ribosomal protein S11 [Candidatus Aminicenantes bacterium]|nr:30S ribosomal protein S11 [Candidatus Aminicenantes bacterium]
MAKPKKKTKKKKIRKDVGYGIAHIQSTFNNTIITLADRDGSTLCWASSGSSGFKGARKGTPFAAQLAAKEVSSKARDYGVRYIDVRVKGPGAGRESAIRALQSEGLEIKSIRDITPIPHNGCRQRKRRRV